MMQHVFLLSTKLKFDLSLTESIKMRIDEVYPHSAAGHTIAQWVLMISTWSLQTDGLQIILTSILDQTITYL